MRASLLVLLCLAAGCSAVSHDRVSVEPGHAVLEMDDKKVEVWGVVSAMTALNGRIWFQAAGHAVMVDERSLSVDDRVRSLPSWHLVEVDARGPELRFVVDGKPLP